jgi:SdrD B-like protein/pre-peptidase
MPFPHTAPARSRVERLECRLLLASVGGIIFNDLNANGLRDPGEPGLANRRVFLDKNNNGIFESSERTTLTDRNGRYRFEDVAAASVVRQVLDGGFEQTSPDVANEGFPFTPASVHAGRFDIVFNPGPKLAANRAALDALNAAAAVWEAAFTDRVTVMIDVEIEPRADGADVLATTNAERRNLPYGRVRDLMAADASADEWSLARQLPMESQFRATLADDSANPYRFRGQVRVTRANLKALRAPAEALGSPRSRFDAKVSTDGSIVFNSAFDYDYNPRDGVAAGRQDFFGIALHEIGHVLGFDSAVDDVGDMMLDPSIERNVRPTPLDLYRLEPGRGASDFTNAPRVLAPGSLVERQVFFGGTNFDGLTDLSFPGLRPGEIPFATGTVFGDGSEASHWQDDNGGGPRIGVMDPSADSGRRLGGRLSAYDRRAFGLIGWDLRQPVPGQIVGVGGPGEEAIRNFGARRANPDDQFSEAAAVTIGSTGNFDLFAGDDVDLFQFTVSSGQRLGFDTDTLGGSLDPYIRLFDASGRQLAANDNATAPGESPGPGAYLEHTFTRAGVFFLGVSWKGNTRYDPVRGTGDVPDTRRTGATGRYSLALSDRTVDTNDQISEAIPVRVGATARQDVSPERDADVYRFGVRAGQRVGFDLDRAPRSALDSVLRLFDATGRQLAFNDNGRAPGESQASAGAESYFEFTFSKAGTYYLGVSGRGNAGYNPITGAGDAPGATGSYLLNLLDRPRMSA